MTPTPICDETPSYQRTPLEQQTLDNLDIILDALKIEYNQTAGRFFFPCPIHGSDNYNSMSIYQDSGQAVCFTRNCLQWYGEGFGVFKFVSAVLKCSNNEARVFCKNALANIEQEIGDRPKPKKPIKKDVVKIPIGELPAGNPDIPYLLRRGYSRTIIEKYKCFVCSDKYNLMYGRVVYPIFDDSYEFCIGFVGRTLSPQCPDCKQWHEPTKPCPNCPFELIKTEKWLNSSGLNRNSLLFNLWFSLPFIKEKGEILLTESQNCVLRLEEAGVRNSAGLFGVSLSRKQMEKLGECGAKRVILGLNGAGDAAGTAATLKITKQLETAGFDVQPLSLHKKDFGEMSVSEIRETYQFLL